MNTSDVFDAQNIADVIAKEFGLNISEYQRVELRLLADRLQSFLLLEVETDKIKETVLV